MKGGAGAHLDNIFPDFFPFRYKLFLIIEMDGKTAKAIGEKQVFDTVPISVSSAVCDFSAVGGHFWSFGAYTGPF